MYTQRAPFYCCFLCFFADGQPGLTRRRPADPICIYICIRLHLYICICANTPFSNALWVNPE